MKNIKLPNSYGGVIKMGNASRRRRPYMVRITTGYEINEKTGKSKQKLWNHWICKNKDRKITNACRLP